MEIEAETIINMQKDAELVGAWKVLNWLLFEFEEGMTVEDIEETVHYATSLVSEQLWENFNRQYGVFTHLRDHIEKRMKEKVEVKAK